MMSYLYGQYSKGSLINYSGIERLGYDFSDTVQQNSKIRLILDFKNAKVRDYISSS